MTTFRYPPDALAAMTRGMRIGNWLACVVLLVVSVGFSFAMHDALGHHFGDYARLPPPLLALALSALLVYYSRKTRADLTALTSTSLRLADRKLTQLDGAGGTLAEIDLGAPYKYRYDRNQVVMILVVEQGTQTLRFAQQIEHARDLGALILGPTYRESVSPPEPVAAAPLVFRYRPTTATVKLEEGNMRMARAAMASFFAIGGLVLGLIAAIELALWVGLIFVGIGAACGIGIWRLTNRAVQQHVAGPAGRFATHLTYEADCKLRHLRNDDAAVLATIDLARPFECKYLDKFRVEQGEQVVEFQCDLHGARDLVSWILLYNYDELTSF